MRAVKQHNTIRTETLRAIKTAFMNWETSKEHAGQELAEADEIKKQYPGVDGKRLEQIVQKYLD